MFIYAKASANFWNTVTNIWHYNLLVECYLWNGLGNILIKHKLCCVSSSSPSHDKLSGEKHLIAPPPPPSVASLHCSYRPYAYDVTEGRPAALGVKQNTATCVIAKHAARGANPASHTAGLARPGPRTERLSANAHCQHNTCVLRDTRLASLLWRCDPLWRQCIRSIQIFNVDEFVIVWNAVHKYIIMNMFLPNMDHTMYWKTERNTQFNLTPICVPIIPTTVRLLPFSFQEHTCA